MSKSIIASGRSTICSFDANASRAMLLGLMSHKAAGTMPFKAFRPSGSALGIHNDFSSRKLAYSPERCTKRYSENSRSPHNFNCAR
jgi:hypothetical protein